MQQSQNLIPFGVPLDMVSPEGMLRARRQDLSTKRERFLEMPFPALDVIREIMYLPPLRERVLQ